MKRKRKLAVQMRLEALESRDLLSVTPMPSLVGVVRGGDEWLLSHSQTTPNASDVRRFGQAGAQYLSGDWDGDGKADLIAVTAGADGWLTWRIDTDGDLKADVEHRYGLAGDTAFVGDWNGDNVLDV